MRVNGLFGGSFLDRKVADGFMSIGTAYMQRATNQNQQQGGGAFIGKEGRSMCHTIAAVEQQGRQVFEDRQGLLMEVRY